MRWFWLFILGLVLLTGGLYAKRVRTKPAISSPSVPHATNTEFSQSPESSKQPIVVEPDPEPEPIEPEVQVAVEEIVEVQIEPAVDESLSEPDPVIEPAVDSAQDAEAENTPEPEAIVQEETEPIDEAVQEPVEQVRVQEKPVPVVVEEPVLPSYVMLGDGSFKILDSGIVIDGAGTKANPFVLDWSVLRSIEQGYNPKQGKNQLPDWLDVLNERHVKITGNTLVPVIATTTRELLVMQNPWDGCCVGVPPSPYDAIEVTLDHDVDFGSSAVGYGTVEGLFILDPYVVDGWVLGIYLIEEAKYRNGDGIAFPDF